MARPSSPRPVSRFALAGLVAMLLVSIGFVLASRWAGTNEAIRDAERTMAVLAAGVVEPVLTDALLTGDQEALAVLDRVVRGQVLTDSVVRLKLWDSTGRLLYSDEPRLIGETFPISDEELEVLATGEAHSEVSDLTKPENRFETGYGTLLELYVPVETNGGQRLLLEGYFPYELVTVASRTIWLAFAPIGIGGLILLQLVQLPLAASLARRLDRHREERERLLRRAIEASDATRRRIAADLHDGVVQDLAALSYRLAATAEQAPAVGSALRQDASLARKAMRSLRTLLVDIYPPTLASAGLAVATAALLDEVSERGLETRLQMEEAIKLPAELEALCYRFIQEAVRNATTHAGADLIDVTIKRRNGHVAVEVADDGPGFEPPLLVDLTREGHLGLQLLSDLAADVGGSFEIDSRPGQGTTVRMAVPLP